MDRPNPGKLVAMTAITAVKRKAEDSDEMMGVVVQSQLADVGEASQEVLPTMNAMKQRVQHIRRKLDNVPPKPKSLHDLIVPEKYRM